MLKIGIEKEALIFKDDYKPQNYSHNELNDNITVDFSSNQIELISHPHKNISDLLQEMYTYLNEDKIIRYKTWPLSQPAISNYEVDFSAIKNQDKINYRKKLLEKYGQNFMNVSGIHISVNLEGLSEEQCFELQKKIYKYGFVILQFFSFTPYYQDGILDKDMNKICKNKGYENSLSIRNSQKHGYYNEQKLKLDYSNLQNYQESIQKQIDNQNIQSPKELYAKVRLKKNKNDESYIELRFIDLNPYYRLGISYEQLQLMAIFVEYLNNVELTSFDIDESLYNFEQVSLQGQNKSLNIKFSNETKTLKEWTEQFFNQMISSTNLNSFQKEILQSFLNQYQNNQLDIDKMIKEITKENLSILEFGKKHIFQKEKYTDLYPESSMELSTKILINEAKKKQYKVEILDEYTNTIQISKNQHEEIIVQATKTNADKYVNILLMENKVMTKQILAKNNIKIAEGYQLLKDEEVDYKFFKDNKVVIKPDDTNFGQGITILNKQENTEEIDKALSYAFKYSNRVLIEKFFSGVEYRFLVIDNEVVSIVNRIPAHVIGNGKDTIKKLIEKKNSSPIRGNDYKKPLEKIKLGNIEIDYLRNQGKNADYVPKNKEIIYLRENSNVSTGGDSMEVTGLLWEKYNNIAIEVAKSLNVKICGVDMMINHQNNDYIIVEANFNPAIQMHTYTEYGIGKNPADKILNLLFAK